MRAVTFSDPKVSAKAEQAFVGVWKNIQPSVKFYKESFEGEAGEGIVKRLRPGTGATNICAHLATPDGRIVHAVPGFAGPEMFLRELDFALEVARSFRTEAVGEDLKRMYERRLAAVPEDEEWSRKALKPALTWLARSPLPPLEEILSATRAGPPRE